MKKKSRRVLTFSYFLARLFDYFASSLIHIAMSSAEVLVLRGTLEGHNGWVTSLATSPAQPNLLLSGSRDKSLITWKLTGDDQQYGVPVRSFRGHSHIVQDCTVTPDGEYALSASWDKTVRLWELATGKCIQRFVGHKSDVLSVTIDRRASQIVSASRDKTVKVWNTLGECMVTLLGHNDWVSQVRVAPNESPEDETVTVISAGMDKVVKVCSTNTMKPNTRFFLNFFHAFPHMMLHNICYFGWAFAPE